MQDLDCNMELSIRQVIIFNILLMVAVAMVAERHPLPGGTQMNQVSSAGQ